MLRACAARARVSRHSMPLRRRPFSSAASGARSVGKAEVPRPTREQLFRLALVNGIPMVGFGIADNLIMIVAGDMIDKSIGVTMGISTLAAAGIGNLISDVFGIGTGDVIDRYSERIIGKSRSPPMSLEQLATSAARKTKTLATVIGISIGCIIGMFPLLFLGEKKELYFTTEELALYESALRPYGVSPANFFEMMRLSKWRELEEGEVLVEAGGRMDRIVLLAAGSIDSYDTGGDGARTPVYRYRAKADIANLGAVASSRSSVPIRGCVVGGTALLDASVRDHPYPSTCLAAEPTRVVEFDYGALRKAMDENAAIEAAMLSILYFDLVEGLRRRGQYDYNSEKAESRESETADEARLSRTKSHGERVDTRVCRNRVQRHFNMS